MELFKRPMSKNDITNEVTTFYKLAEKEKQNLQIKLKYSKELAIETGQILFGKNRRDNDNSFICPLCGNDSPGVSCAHGLLKTIFECPNCKFRGNLYNFYSKKNGREKATRDDFLSVDAVSYGADQGLMAVEVFGDEDYFPPEMYAEWERTQEHSSSFEKERISLDRFLYSHLQ